ncbi:hypothetical protein BDF22DRAFT_141033 [Syncephalis plumigaleata]|nr:hypothetical protein BDF22DRAFT_141033 [Syncephalis plumigaleata]
MHHGYHRAQHGSYNYPPHDGRVVSASASHAHSYMAHPSSSSYHSMATPNAAAARQQHESPIMTQHRSHVLPSGAASTNGHLATGSRYTVHDYAGGNSGTNRADPRLYYPTDSHDPHINHAHGRINGAGGVHQDIRDPSMANYPGSVYSSHMHDGDIIREAWDRADRRNYTMPSDWHDPSRSGISAAAGYPDIHDERVYRSVPSTATSAATDVHHRRASIVSSGKLASSARADHAHYHSQAQQYQHAHQHPQRSSTTPQPASSSVIPSTASRKSEHVVGAKQGYQI